MVERIMPSGYTYNLSEKDISFNEFVWTCAREMAALSHMKYSSLDAPPTPPKKKNFHTEHLQKAKKEKARINKLTLKEVELVLNKRYAEEQSSCKKTIEELSVKKVRYQAMLDKLKTWKCPAILKDFRTFMIQQVEESMEYECNIPHYEALLSRPKQSPKEYLAALKDYNKRDIDFWTKAVKESDANYKKAINWFETLSSLVPLPKSK